MDLSFQVVLYFRFTKLENEISHSMQKINPLPLLPPNFSELTLWTFSGLPIISAILQISMGRFKNKGNKAILYPTKLDHSQILI